MTSTFITSRQLDRAPAKAKRASLKGPVFITERGEVQFVLLSVAAYQRLAGRRTTLAEALGMPGEYIEFEPEQMGNHARADDPSADRN